jgi:hypothetical protein
MPEYAPGMGTKRSARPIAHRRRDDDATHDLEEHLRAAARLAGRFDEAWGATEAAALAVLWHDLGKYAVEFEAMINSTDPEAHLEGVAGGPRSPSITPVPARSGRCIASETAPSAGCSRIRSQAITPGSRIGSAKAEGLAFTKPSCLREGLPYMAGHA